MTKELKQELVLKVYEKLGTRAFVHMLRDHGYLCPECGELSVQRTEHHEATENSIACTVGLGIYDCGSCGITFKYSDYI